ncbi:uncharacterized protein [Montipora foliosa]|uniref:uncharacterized protein n=1 Tax=Montipora foliosa TaxID=591990 RepID=UPI0035F20331
MTLLLKSSARVVTVLFILQDRLGLLEVWDFSTNNAFVLRHECASILFRSFACMDVTFINRKSISALVVYRPPGTGAAIGLFFEEFSALLEEVVVCSEELLIFGDFNFHMDDTADRYAAHFGSLLELFSLKQHVTVPTHRSGHILDLVISRMDAEALKVIELVVMEQFISGYKPLNERKSVFSRRLRNFDFEAFNERIISSSLLADVSDLSLELMVDRYDNVLCDTMDILPPVKSRTIVLPPNAPWYNEDIGNEKRKRRRLERRWRSSRLESDRLSYIEQFSVVNTILYEAKEFYYSSVVRDSAHDTRLLFRSIDTLLQRQTVKRYPSADNDQQLANDFADFFTAKIERIREELAFRKSGLVHFPGLIKPACLSRLSEFDLVTDDDVLKLIRGSTIKACNLDPLPATIMRSCYSALVPVFKTVIRQSVAVDWIDARGS